MLYERNKGRKNSPLSVRVVILSLFYVLLIVVVWRLYSLQILNGESYQDNFSLSITKTRDLESARGNIYDRNGNPIAYNELSYCVTFEDSIKYENMEKKNLSINSTLYHIIKLIEEQGDSIVEDFKIKLTKDGTYEYTV